MKTRFTPYFIAVVSIIILAMPSVAASSQDKPVSIKLGVVNLDDVTRLSLMSKDIARQIDARRKEFRDEIKKEEEKSKR